MRKTTPSPFGRCKSCRRRGRVHKQLRLCSRCQFGRVVREVRASQSPRSPAS